jgi:CRP/FNR family transcriptional regulator, cyclic AMP receptor protein
MRKHQTCTTVRDLQTMCLLKNVPFDVVNAIRAAGTVREYGAGALLSAPGMVLPDVCFLLSGTITCYLTSPSGKRADLHSIEAGDTFGLEHTLPGCRAELYAEIASDVAKIHHVAAERFESIIQESSLLAGNCLRWAFERSDAAYKRIDMVELHTVKDRIEGKLAELAEQSNDVDIHITQDELGRLIGTSREEVSRALSELRRSGLVLKPSPQGVIRLGSGMMPRVH